VFGSSFILHHCRKPGLKYNRPTGWLAAGAAGATIERFNTSIAAMPQPT